MRFSSEQIQKLGFSLPAKCTKERGWGKREGVKGEGRGKEEVHLRRNDISSIF
jgi:hypothetical protein